MAILVLVCLVGCRFEDRTPGGSRREDAVLQSLVSGFYRALANRDTVGLDRTSLPAATALLAGPGGVVLVPMVTMVRVPERRNSSGGTRLARVDLRPDGDVATVRVVVTATTAGDGREYEATDFLTVAHREGAWRVAQAVFGPWRSRSAP